MKKKSRRLFLFSIPAALISFYFSCSKKRWKYIVIHHSGGSFGNHNFLKKVHRQRFPKSSYMAYHFVVGNGNGMKAGQVAYGRRWREKRWGAHVSIRNRRLNYDGIGICMIGNFEKEKMNKEQYKSMVNLVKYLKEMYKIPEENILFHGKIKNEQTLCPGKYFPFDKLKKDLIA